MKEVKESYIVEQAKKGEVYPCTIVMDRYGGSYSGAEWLAFNLDNTEVPDEIGGGDPDEDIFWREHDPYKMPVGKGSTPDEAYASLINLIIKQYS